MTEFDNFIHAAKVARAYIKSLWTGVRFIGEYPNCLAGFISGMSWVVE